MNKSQKQEVIRLQLKKFYNTSQAYLDRLNKHGEKDFAYYTDLCKKYLPINSSILDCGCGTGFSSFLLAKADFKVAGMEISQLFLSEAMRKYGNQKGLSFCLGDAMEMPFPDSSFDAVCSFHFLEHVPDIKCVLREMSRVVKRGGLIVIIAPNFLDPIGLYLNMAIKWQVKENYKPWETKTRIATLYKFVKLLFLGVSKAIGLNRKIYYLQPVLSNDKDVCGNDFDATWLTNRFDIERILKKSGFSIENTLSQFKSNTIIPLMRLLRLPKVLQTFYIKLRAKIIVIARK